MSFDPHSTGLPVTEIIPQVKQNLAENNSLIISAPPGAGKSTVLPLVLLDEPWLQGKKILMLEPRRLAARTIAIRMADLLGEQIGETVGYRIRFENRISEKTRIEVVTEGILTRMIQSDNSLGSVGIVIFDEFHERSIHADVAMAFCREVQQVLRPDLRIMVMSATLDMPQLSSLLNAPVLESKGRQYPVDIIYTGSQDLMMIPELTARTVIKASREKSGDILVFLPGEAEIRKTAEILERELAAFSIHPLYGALPPQEQYRAIMPNRHGKRKIVLATSIAETSLTIEGISIVVDSGFSRISRFDPRSGLSRLETVMLSKDSADQRAGRAGRLGPGTAYRMWSAATHDRLAEHSIPEILEADLASLVLDMAIWGVNDINKLSWLSPPPAAALAQAYEQLHQLGALEKGKITAHGKELHRLACHPRLAHMLLKANEDGVPGLGTDIAAILEEKDPLGREAGIDINLRIEALRRARKNNTLANRFARIEKVAESYRRMLGVQVENDPIDPFETGLLLAYAYPERIASARPGNNAQFQLANGKYAAIGHKDDLSHEAWLAVAHMDTRDGLGKIFLASPLNPKDLISMVKEQEQISWDTRKGGLIASRDLKIGSIILRSTPLAEPDPELKNAAIAEAVRTEGSNLLNLDETFTQLQNRIESLRTWNPDEEWPQVDTASLLEHNQEWLSFYYSQVKKNEDFKKINVVEALRNYLGYEKLRLLDELAPAKLVVPSGSQISIEYQPNGANPVLSVRLQELFGLADTPGINRGKISVVMHLLSPGYKPVQVTTDLRSFWNNTYFEVKKELQRRYPKHAWPDDPWSAVPVAKGRSKK